MDSLILFFDVETNGLPIKREAPVNDVNNWPRVTQLAFSTYTTSGEKVGACCEWIKPAGWTVPKTEFFLENGITTEKCEIYGKPIREMLRKFVDQYNLCDYVVAHNLKFDNHVLGAEMIRTAIMPSKKCAKFCTMEASTDLLKLKGKYGKYKWPKLEELHLYLFNETFEGAHDALVDIDATARCFFELVKREVIKL